MIEGHFILDYNCKLMCEPKMGLQSMTAITYMHVILKHKDHGHFCAPLGRAPYHVESPSGFLERHYKISISYHVS